MQVGCPDFCGGGIESGPQKRTTRLRFSGFRLCGRWGNGRGGTANRTCHGLASHNEWHLSRAGDFLLASCFGNCNHRPAGKRYMPGSWPDRSSYRGRTRWALPQAQALLQALPLLQELLASYAGYLQ